MLRLFQSPTRQLATETLVVAAMFWTMASAHAQAETEGNVPIGRLNFQAANLPEANVEVDLSEEMFGDLFGIGDAALTGVAEALLKAPNDSDSGKATQVAAKQTEALRQIVQLAGNVVREVHVRVYEDLPIDASGLAALYKPFDEQLRSSNWETLARIRKDDEAVRVAAIRDGGSIRGIFVMATDGDNLVLANLVCEVSPENVQKLMSSATQIGLDNGLAKKIQLKLNPTIVINGDFDAQDPPKLPVRRQKTE